MSGERAAPPELVYGTTNTAKIAFMQSCLQALRDECGLTLTGLGALSRDIPEVEETGATPLENARIKARAYYAVLRRPVFSLDSGLYFSGLPANLQPGLHVRTVNGKRLSDDEMLAHYARLARDNGGRLIARYRNGICLALGQNTLLEHDGDDIATREFAILPAAHPKRVPGFPLDSLSADPKTGRYFYDLPENDAEADKENAWATRQGFLAFFRAALPAILRHSAQAGT